MTSAADSLFVDTNVLVYAIWAAAPLHAHARSGAAAHRSACAPLYISRQVIREWLATLNLPRTGPRCERAPSATPPQRRKWRRDRSRAGAGRTPVGVGGKGRANGAE